MQIVPVIATFGRIEGFVPHFDRRTGRAGGWRVHQGEKGQALHLEREITGRRPHGVRGDDPGGERAFMDWPAMDPTAAAIKFETSWQARRLVPHGTVGDSEAIGIVPFGGTQ